MGFLHTRMPPERYAPLSFLSRTIAEVYHLSKELGVSVQAMGTGDFLAEVLRQEATRQQQQ